MFQLHCRLLYVCCQVYVCMVLLSTADSHELREKERMRLSTDVTEMVCSVLVCSVCASVALYAVVCISCILHSLWGNITVSN